jgi:NAD(P)H-dependent FMN reductase
MSQVPRVLGFAGALRAESWNKKLVRLALDGARAAGADVTYLDLREVPMPLYDADIEKSEGIPPNAKRFKELLIAHDGFLIATPEYNSSISGALKNAIDWASRAAPGEAPLVCFEDKVVGLMSASPGALGGLRGLMTLRSILSSIRVFVLPDQLAVSRAHEAFDEHGKLKDAKQQAAVEKIGARVATVIRKLAADR